MKHVKLFVALFAMLALGVTNAWGEDVSVTWPNTTALSTTATNVAGDANVTIKVSEANTYTNPLRFYAGKTTTIEVAEGCQLKSVAYEASSTGNYVTYAQGATVSPKVTPSVNGKIITWDLSGSNTKTFTFNPSSQTRCNGITITYTPASGGDVIVKTLKSIAVKGMTTDYKTGDIFKFDGTCTATYSVTKNDVAQENEQKVVTPTSVSEPDMSNTGEQEVTVTYTENKVTVTATYTINVTENVITAGEYALALNNTFFGTAAAANVSAFPTSAKQDNITVTLSGGGTKTRTDADCVRMYQNNTLTFSVPASYVITSISFAEPSSKQWDGKITVDAGTGTGTYTDGTKSWAGSAQEVVFSFGAQNRIATATVTYAEAGETPEVPTITAPTFSLTEGTYNEAKEVTLSAKEGTIHYTLDGTTPNAESTAYAAPIVLDECGTTTIKAIAISGETTSSVASATYTIKLPLNNSQANPYTEAEAIAVYDGGCYDNQDVYVKGVVANAQFFSKSNTYTITLEGGFQFYKFYEAAGDTAFTADYIVAGDTLVACGKLVKFNTTYELGAGCYLVERKPYSAPKVDISNTPETAYTVAQAIALIDDITSDLTKGVYVKGQISEVESFNDYYGSITYWIKDEEKNTFQCYSGLGLNSEQFASVDDLVVGSQVVVYGTLKKHNSTYELDKNNYIVSLTLPSYTVTATAENGTVEGAGEYEHGTEVTLTATPADGYKFACWTSGEDTVSIENPYTFTVTANVALVANFKEVVTETVYFVNNQGWENVNVYAWTTDINAAWPGVAATKETEQICGYDVYSYTAEAGAYATVIFNNGNNGQQTADLVWTAGKYYVQNAWYTREDAEALLAGTGIPSVITYVLRGVGDDWTVGIALSANPDDENEYVLLGQDIAEGDAVKVVTLTDGLATAYCGKVDEYSVAHSFDDNGNIVLAPGKYDFYFKVNEDLIYIAAVNPGTATALENIAVEGKAVKAIVNGQLIIIKNGVQYNAQGQVIK